jgi:glyoxylase-like metal-dependent hydrolase (beta-lactamase superfamily II)
MSQNVPHHEIIALCYATRPGRRPEHFLGGDPHDGPMPMAYYVWIIRDGRRVVLFDTGFNAQVAARRGRTHLRCPIDSLRLLDIDPADISDVVISHLHYDHIGNFALLPNARFHIQEPEVHHATGRHVRYACVSHHFEVEDVVGVVRLNFAGRVHMYNGPHALAPGLALLPTHGHSAGHQSMVVSTARGDVVLAADASHFYENVEKRRPFSTLVHVADTLDSFEKLHAAAASPAHIIPGHDPLVLARYPAVSEALKGVAVRVDCEPVG